MKKTTRRQFLGNGAMAAMTGTAIFASAKTEKKLEKVFIHQVYFWLKNPDSKTDFEKLKEGLTKLSKVKTIKQFHIGKPAGTSREVIDGTYAISWFTMFENAADQDSYQKDPIHLKFVEDHSSLWKKVIVYDSIDT